MSADQFFGGDHADCKMTLVGKMPTYESNGHIYVSGIVNKKPVSFIFDTGAQDTILTKAAIARLGISPWRKNADEIEGIGGKESVDKYRLHFLLDGIHGDWERYVFGSNLESGWHTVARDGLIGPSFFIGHDIDLDLPDNKIILYFPEHDCSHPSAFLNGPLTDLPLAHPEIKIRDTASTDTKRILAFIATTLNASPKILISIGGKPLVAAIDSGAPRSLLFLSGMQKIGIAQGQIAHDKYTVALGIGPQPVPGVEHMLTNIDLGELEIVQLPTIIVDQDLSDGVDMLLGLDFLKTVHVWISYSSNSLIMQYPPSSSPISASAH